MTDDDVTPYLHMDDQWMWRFFFLDKLGKVAVMSAKAYFTRQEAEGAMRLFKARLRVIACASNSSLCTTAPTSPHSPPCGVSLHARPRVQVLRPFRSLWSY